MPLACRTSPVGQMSPAGRVPLAGWMSLAGWMYLVGRMRGGRGKLRAWRMLRACRSTC